MFVNLALLRANDLNVSRVANDSSQSRIATMEADRGLPSRMDNSPMKAPGQDPLIGFRRGLALR